MKVWIKVKVMETKWVEVECEDPSTATSTYVPGDNENVTGDVAIPWRREAEGDQ